MTKQELLDALVVKAKEADAQQCDDRYDEGYADAMYDAIFVVKEFLENV